MTSPDPLAGLQDAAESAPSAGESRPRENAVLLTNQGWAALEKGEPQLALQRFRRALRLQPDHLAARKGIVEALKARHPLYRWLLGWLFWMGRFPPAIQIGVMLAALVALQLITSFAASGTQWAPLLWPLIIVFFGLSVLSGLASPLFDVMLRLDPVGNQSLDQDQRRGTTLLLINLIAPLPLLVWSICLNHGLGIVVWILLSMTALPSSAIFRCVPGWPRWIMSGLTLGVLALIAPLLASVFVDLSGWQDADRANLIAACVYSLIVVQLAAAALMAVRTRS